MAKRKKLKKEQAVSLLVVLTVILLLIGSLLGVILREIREKQALRSAVQETAKAEQNLPRSTYTAEGFFWQEERAGYQDEQYDSRAGIDVSSFQMEIDWEQVAADGIDFAIIQLGYRGYSDGVLYEDERFRENLEGAQAVGLETGVYFFSQALSADEAREEALYVVEQLDGAALEQPIFFDWEEIEFDTARTDGLPGNVVTVCAKAFCETVEEAGYDAGIYFNQHDVYSRIDIRELIDYPLWLAQYNDMPDMIYPFCYWQYSANGSVSGILTPVDMNIQFIKKES